MSGDDETKVQGTLIPPISATADVTVQESPGQSAINPAEVNFSISSPPIILNGQVPAGTPISGGSFSGPGVSLKMIGPPINANRYTFNPSTLNVGAYSVVYSYADPSMGCICSKTNTFNAFSVAIIGYMGTSCQTANTA